MAKKTGSKQKFDLQTKLTIALATVVLAINCYTLSATYVEVSNNDYVVVEEA